MQKTPDTTNNAKFNGRRNRYHRLSNLVSKFKAIKAKFHIRKNKLHCGLRDGVNNCLTLSELVLYFGNCDSSQSKTMHGTQYGLKCQVINNKRSKSRRYHVCQTVIGNASTFLQISREAHFLTEPFFASDVASREHLSRI